MPLVPGTHLGQYEIVSSLGEGGMGAVYRALDTRLKRDVAIKVLLPEVAHDPERLARFEREAQILAALNHPNIAHLYGLEGQEGPVGQVGQEGREGPEGGLGPFLVMEYVDGPTLADRIADGPVPVDEALAIARQVAEALEAAHEQGIVHRDLKPANIKVRPDGTVKVLDFGLAKAIDVGRSTPTANLSVSPTLTSPVLVTGAGVLLGTAAYMSPEQAKGRGADRASDIWALGCVLFEMLTGRRPFRGDDVSEAVASILRDEPEWGALPASLPGGVRQVLRLALQKDRARRLRDASSIRLAIDGAFDANAQETPGGPQRTWPRRASIAAVGVAALALGAAAAWSARPQPTRTAAPTTRLTITPPTDAAVRVIGSKSLAISPDGRRIVFRTGQRLPNRTSLLWLRNRDAFESVRLPATTGATGVAFSPDGRSVVFAADSVLKRMDATGGQADTLCKIDGAPRGIVWMADGSIVFATDRSKGLMRVSAAGGTPEYLTRAEESSPVHHLWPAVVPGEPVVLFTIWERPLSRSRIAALSLDDSRVTTLRPGTSPAYLPTGHLLFADSDEALKAVPFDVQRLSVSGEPVVLDRVGVDTLTGAALFALADDGTLVYSPRATPLAPKRTIVWVDRSGNEEPTGTPVRSYTYARLSPDGSKVALDARDEQADIWIWDLARRTLERLTNDIGPNRLPTWSPDGRRLAFTAGHDSAESVFWQAADGSGSAEQLGDGSRVEGPQAFTPDGRELITTTPLTPPYDIGVLALGSERGYRTLLGSTASESNAEISPDGRWLAYESDESGQSEVYVRPYPAVDTTRRQVSSGGGSRPLWSRATDELFYYAEAAEALMAVSVKRDRELSLGVPYVALKWAYGLPTNTGRHYDVSRDGRRFLVLKDVADTDTGQEIRVVLNWLDEVRGKLSAASR